VLQAEARLGGRGARGVVFSEHDVQVAEAGLLRLTGARLATPRRVVALEGAIPLLAIAAVAICTGFGAAAMLASEAQQHPMAAPGADYYLITAGGIR
jgi:hypothetical protein